MNDASASELGNGPKTPAPFPANWVPVVEKPVFSARKIDVVCIGAGFSGLTLAYKWKHEGANEFINLTIFEKNEGVGGTWFENRYPGVACDVPAHIYTFTFEPNPDWTSFYASGPEILQYIKRTTEKYQLDERVQLNSRVTSAIWDDAAAKWKIRVNQGGQSVETEADVLINGSGILNKWHWPQIKGLDSFRGQLVHSADWDESLDWKDKRVAVIGNGSSAIQILPQMQPTASKVVTYIRSPTWITSNFAAQLTPEGKNFDYSEADKRTWRENPEEHLKLRLHIEHEFNKFFPSYLSDGVQQAEMNKLFRKTMEQRLNYNADLCAKLIPDFKVGCRRISPGDGYLEALQEKNVRIDFTPVEEITPTGIRSGQGHEEFDIIVCATGFDVSFIPPWEMTGKNGVSLAEQWKDAPYAYFSICTPNMPNYFIYNGPNCPIAHGSLIPVIEWSTNFILKWCRKIATEDIRCVVVDAQATDDYNVYSMEFLKRTVWTGRCRSWFKNYKVDGRITAMYSGSSLHYKEIIDSFRAEDFVIEYNSPNRFRFMGNGLTIREESGGDLSFYLKK